MDQLKIIQSNAELLTPAQNTNYQGIYIDENSVSLGKLYVLFNIIISWSVKEYLLQAH